MEGMIVRPSHGTMYGQALPSAGNNTDKDTFLRLLTAQLQYQDPLAPMDNTQMVAQLAQFTTLEQMQNLTTLQLQQTAVSYLGKYVTGVDAGSQEVWSGQVSRIYFEQGVPLLQVGNRLVTVAEIGLVEAAAPEQPAQPGSEEA